MMEAIERGTYGPRATCWTMGFDSPDALRAWLQQMDPNGDYDDCTHEEMCAVVLAWQDDASATINRLWNERLGR